MHCREELALEVVEVAEQLGRSLRHAVLLFFQLMLHAPVESVVRNSEIGEITLSVLSMEKHLVVELTRLLRSERVADQI